MERLQILITAEQRRLLEAEALRSRASMSALVRDAIDGRYGTVSRAARLRAVRKLGTMSAGRVSPQELARMIEDERDEMARGLGLDPPR